MNKTQELRGGFESDSRTKTQEDWVNQTQESRCKNQDEEIVLEVDGERFEEVVAIDGDGFGMNVAKESGGKILTLSPLTEARSEGVMVERAGCARQGLLCTV